MTIRGIRFRLHPLLLAAFIVGLMTHEGVLFAVIMVVVLLHESGHVLAARMLGYEVESIEILPFGGVARLKSGHLGFAPRDETIIAISGPAVNLVLLLIAAMLHLAGVIRESVATDLATMNLTLFFFNLLPALPLDGGRIARAALAQSRGYYLATKAVLRMSFVLSAVLMVLGSLSILLGFTDDGLVLLGVFLLVSAYTSARQTQYDLLRFLDAKRRERKEGAKPLITLWSGSTTPISQVARRIAPGAHHVIEVHTGTPDAKSPSPDHPFSRVVRIDEDLLLESIFERGLWSEPISVLTRTCK